MSYAEEYPFNSVSNALMRGYAAEARHLYQRDSTFSQYQGGSVRLPSSPYAEGLNAWEKAADAGKVVGLVRRTLSGPVLLAVEAYYLPNEKSDPAVVFRKQYSCSGLIPYVRLNMKAPPPDGFIASAVGAWAGAVKWTDEDNEQWASHLKVSVKTLQRWRFGRQGYTQGMDSMLNDCLDLARRKLGQPMRDYGLIP